MGPTQQHPVATIDRCRQEALQLQEDMAHGTQLSNAINSAWKFNDKATHLLPNSSNLIFWSQANQSVCGLFFTDSSTNIQEWEDWSPSSNLWAAPSLAGLPSLLQPSSILCHLPHSHLSTQVPHSHTNTPAAPHPSERYQHYPAASPPPPIAALPELPASSWSSSYWPLLNLFVPPPTPVWGEGNMGKFHPQGLIWCWGKGADELGY